MNPQATIMLQKLLRAAATLVRFITRGTAYNGYVRRRRLEHPNLPVMTYQEFLQR